MAGGEECAVESPVDSTTLPTTVPGTNQRAHLVVAFSGFIPGPIPKTHSSPLATPPDISCASFFSRAGKFWSLLMGVYIPRRTLLFAWGGGSRTRFWWSRLTWLILGIYNVQGLDVAGLLSGPQPSSSTLPNLSFWPVLTRAFTLRVDFAEHGPAISLLV